MNNKFLFLLLCALIGIYLVNRWMSGNRDRSFQTELIAIDTARVTSVTILPKGGQAADEVTLKRESGGWIASKGAVSTRSPQDPIDALLAQLSLIKSERIVANKEEKWSEYEVGEGQGTRIRVYAGEKLLEDFMVGRFNFNQQNRTMTTYLRLDGEREVYAVDGMQTMGLNSGFDTYRNRQVLDLDPVTLNRFNWESTNPDSIFRAERVDGSWLANGENVLDSASVSGFLQPLQTLRGTAFADDYPGARDRAEYLGKLSLWPQDGDEPVEVECYFDSTRAQPFVFHSSFNPDAYFASDSTGLYRSLVQKPTELLGVW